jgi:hypothetical protein
VGERRGNARSRFVSRLCPCGDRGSERHVPAGPSGSWVRGVLRSAPGFIWIGTFGRCSDSVLVTSVTGSGRWRGTFGDGVPGPLSGQGLCFPTDNENREDNENRDGQRDRKVRGRESRSLSFEGLAVDTNNARHSAHDQGNRAGPSKRWSVCALRPLGHRPTLPRHVAAALRSRADDGCRDPGRDCCGPDTVARRDPAGAPVRGLRATRGGPFIRRLKRGPVRSPSPFSQTEPFMPSALSSHQSLETRQKHVWECFFGPGRGFLRSRASPPWLAHRFSRLVVPVPL